RPLSGLWASPWRIAFSTSGCTDNTGMVTVSTSGAIRRVTASRSPKRACQHRDGHGQHFGRDPQGDGEPLTEACLLEHQVALDRFELLLQGGVFAVPAERVAGELGEVHEQVAGTVGVGAHEGGDGVERVVDEV